MKGTPLYMAPEILSNHSCSMKGDVYAFGIILFEIVTGKTPFKGLDFFQLIKKVSEGERPIIDGDVPLHFRKMIEACWSQLPEERPTFEDIVNELKNNQEFISDSIDELNYINYIDFVDNYEISFDLYKKHIVFDDFLKGNHGNPTLKNASKT